MNETTNAESDGGQDDPVADGSADASTSNDSPLAGHDPSIGLPLESVFDILRNERRQHVLAYLAVSSDETVKIGELAEHIAAIENDLSIDALTSQQRKRVYVALYQCHLPKMANADVVSFDKDRGTVTAGSNFDQLNPYLDVEQAGEDDRTADPPLPYLVLTAAAVVAYLAASIVDTGGVVAGGVVLFLGAVAFLAMTYVN